MASLLQGFEEVQLVKPVGKNGDDRYRFRCTF